MHVTSTAYRGSSLIALIVGLYFVQQENMVLKENAEGLSSFFQLIEKHKDKKKIVALFCGGKTNEGVSWCPDCVSAEPVIEKALETAALEDGVFIYCSVGDRTSWKNPSSEFRTHADLRLTGVPTLLLWKTPKRLVEEECCKSDLVQMFFEDL